MPKYNVQKTRSGKFAVIVTDEDGIALVESTYDIRNDAEDRRKLLQGGKRTPRQESRRKT